MKIDESIFNVTKEEKEEFVNILPYLRIVYNLSTAEVAEVLKCTKQAINNIELRKNKMSNPIYICLKMYFDMKELMCPGSYNKARAMYNSLSEVGLDRKIKIAVR